MITLPAAVVIGGASIIGENIARQIDKEGSKMCPAFAAAAIQHTLGIITLSGSFSFAFLPIAFHAIKLSADESTRSYAIALDNLLRLASRVVIAAAVSMATIAMTPSISMVLSGLLAVYLTGRFFVDLGNTIKQGLNFDPKHSYLYV